jgi:hypothetical protein
MKTSRGTFAHGYELPEWSALELEIFEGIDRRFEKPHQSPAGREAILRGGWGIFDLERHTTYWENGFVIPRALANR